MALNDQPVDNLPENEEAEHETAHYLNTPMQVSTPQDEGYAQCQSNAGLIVGEFAVLRRSFHCWGRAINGESAACAGVAPFWGAGGAQSKRRRLPDPQI